MGVVMQLLLHIRRVSQYVGIQSDGVIDVVPISKFSVASCHNPSVYGAWWYGRLDDASFVKDRFFLGACKQFPVFFGSSLIRELGAGRAVNSSPTVGIIDPCYNQGQYASECIDSLHRQTYPYWRAVLLNDASTDEVIPQMPVPNLQTIKFASLTSQRILAERWSGTSGCNFSGTLITF